MTAQKADYPLDYAKAAEVDQNRLQAFAEKASDRVLEAADSALDTAGKAVEQARVYGEKAQETVETFQSYVSKSLKEQPMATLAVAAVIGAVLGALWKK